MTEKAMHTEWDKKKVTYLMRVYINGTCPHPHDPKDVDWCID